MIWFSLFLLLCLCKVILVFGESQFIFASQIVQQFLFSFGFSFIIFVLFLRVRFMFKFDYIFFFKCFQLSLLIALFKF